MFTGVCLSMGWGAWSRGAWSQRGAWSWEGGPGPWGGGVPGPRGPGPVCVPGHRGGSVPRGVPGPRGEVSVPRGFWSWGVPGRGLPGGDPLRTATAVGSMHPTGMHSCLR